MSTRPAAKIQWLILGLALSILVMSIVPETIDAKTQKEAREPEQSPGLTHREFGVLMKGLKKFVSKLSRIIGFFLMPPKECCADMKWSPFCKASGNMNIKAHTRYSVIQYDGVVHDVAELLIKAARCIASLVTLDETSFKRDNCCKSIPVPVWC